MAHRLQAGVGGKAWRVKELGGTEAAFEAEFRTGEGGSLQGGSVRHVITRVQACNIRLFFHNEHAMMTFSSFFRDSYHELVTRQRPSR